jgi:hypothetical protein
MATSLLAQEQACNKLTTKEACIAEPQRSGSYTKSGAGGATPPALLALLALGLLALAAV